MTNSVLEICVCVSFIYGSIKISYPFMNFCGGTANIRLEILNEWDCMYAWNNKREENHICFAVIRFSPPLFPLLASKGKHILALWVRENERGSRFGCISCGGEGGRTQIRWQQERFGIFLYYIPSWMSCVLCAAELAVYSTPVLEERGDRPQVGSYPLSPLFCTG